MQLTRNCLFEIFVVMRPRRGRASKYITERSTWCLSVCVIKQTSSSGVFAACSGPKLKMCVLCSYSTDEHKWLPRAAFLRTYLSLLHSGYPDWRRVASPLDRPQLRPMLPKGILGLRIMIPLCNEIVHAMKNYRLERRNIAPSKCCSPCLTFPFLEAGPVNRMKCPIIMSNWGLASHNSAEHISKII